MWLDIDRTTPAYKRVTEAGFTLEDPSVDRIPRFGEFDDATYALRVMGRFICVCGKCEYWHLHLTVAEITRRARNPYINFNNRTVDVGKLLEDVGAVSVQHLREDGYTEEQIRQIRKPYETSKLPLLEMRSPIDYTSGRLGVV